MKSILVRYIFGLVCSLLLNSGLVAFAYGQEAKFVLSDIKIAPESAETEMTFSAEVDGRVSVEGNMGTVPDKAHPEQRIVLNNMFHDSAVHHFKGKIPGEVIERKNAWSGIRVNISGYVFEGSMDQPLTFRCVLGKGYVYAGGVGKVILKDGKEIALGKEKTQHDARTSGKELPLPPNATPASAWQVKVISVTKETVLSAMMGGTKMAYIARGTIFGDADTFLILQIKAARTTGSDVLRFTKEDTYVEGENGRKFPMKGLLDAKGNYDPYVVGTTYREPVKLVFPVVWSAGTFKIVPAKGITALELPSIRDTK